MLVCAISYLDGVNEKTLGCGNGKNLQVTPNSVVVGSDNCLELLKIAGDRGGEVGLADCLNLPYRSGVFDSTISIAVIHHLCTEERRIRALQELCRITRPGGSILVYVWAFEQDNKKVLTSTPIIYIY